MQRQDSVTHFGNGTDFAYCLSGIRRVIQKLLQMEQHHHFKWNRISTTAPYKSATERKSMAVATATIEMKPSTLARIKNGIKLRDSSILEIARISSSVCTSTMQLMLPLSQLLPPVSMDIDFTYPSDREIVVWITGRNTVGTSVETESLTAVSVVALAICVLCDPQSEEMSIKRIRLETRSGGYNAGIRQEEDSDY